MLIEFRVANYKSFLEEQIFSMVADEREGDAHLENTFTTKAISDIKLLKSVAIYGPNASGKTTFIKAIKFMRDFVSSPNSCYTQEGKIPTQPFLLDTESRQTPSEFEVTFVHKEKRYQYYFSVDADRVYEERLWVYRREEHEVLFDRKLNDNGTGYEWNFSPKLKGKKVKASETTKSNLLYLSRIAESPDDNEQLYEVHEWFACYLHVIGTGKNGDNEVDDSLEQLPQKPTLDEFNEFIIPFLRDADTGIVNFMPENVNFFLSLNGRMSHGTRDGSPPVIFEETDESLGTWRLFYIGRAILGVLKSGAVLLVDELDMSLHIMIIKGLINLFHNPTLNPHNAQLIFSTHDVTLFKSFRRDQIWFIEKDNGGDSEIYSMSKFEPLLNKQEEFNYLQGRYGAIPLFGDYWEEILNEQNKTTGA